VLDGARTSFVSEKKTGKNAQVERSHARQEGRPGSILTQGGKGHRDKDDIFSGKEGRRKAKNNKKEERKRKLN